MSFIPFLLQNAGDVPGPNSTSGGGFGMLIPLILIVVIMYFFMIRPQNKKQKETQKMLAALKKGDKVITIGGIHGTVTLTKENTVIVKVDDGAKIEFNRSAIASVVVDKPVAETKQEEKKGLFSKNKKAVEAPAVEEKAGTSAETATDASAETAAESKEAEPAAESKAKKSASKKTSQAKTKSKAKTEAK